MLIYHERTGLEVITKTPTGVLDGTYWQDNSDKWRRGKNWQLRVRRRTNGTRWINVSIDALPKRLKMEALLLGLTL